MSVSRETFSRFQDYHELLKRWQKTINLISPTTLNDIWIRHIIDSVQLFGFVTPADSVVDMGSGAGFPGLVLAILGVKKMALVESDGRKAAFLREASRVTKTEVTIMDKRSESIDLKDFSLVVARGFAPLLGLLEIIGGTLKASHKILLLKGKRYSQEIEEAQASWSFEYKVFPSITDPEGVILSMHNFKKLGVL